jgi:hypothetical protein
MIEELVGILIAEPGATTSGGLAIDLLEGRTYMLFCNFQDSPDQPEHFILGMYAGRAIGPAAR